MAPQIRMIHDPGPDKVLMFIARGMHPIRGTLQYLDRPLTTGGANQSDEKIQPFPDEGCPHTTCVEFSVYLYNIVFKKKQRGTSLALSRFFFRFVIPAQIPPTDSDRIIAKIKRTCRKTGILTSENRSRIEADEQCRNAEMQKCIIDAMDKVVYI